MQRISQRPGAVEHHAARRCSPNSRDATHLATLVATRVLHTWHMQTREARRQGGPPSRHRDPPAGPASGGSTSSSPRPRSADLAAPKGGPTAKTVAFASAPVVEGRYTVVFENGEHRTLWVQPAPQGFRAGPLVVSFQSGPDAAADYRPFAHVNHRGEVRIWARYRPESILVEALRVLVEDPRRAARAYGLRARRCFRCHKPLSRPESILRAMGPRCARMFGGRPAEPVAPAAGDADVGFPATQGTETPLPASPGR